MFKGEDLKFGFKQEDKLFPKICNKFGDDLIKTDQMCRWDYESNTVVIELKSRRNKKNTYPTTMIGKQKVDLMMESGKRVISMFKFTDGLYYIEVTKDNICKFEIDRGGRSDRGVDEVNIYYYIPVEMLSLL